MAEWERREKRLIELVLPSGTWGPELHRALYAAESEWREGRGSAPDDPVPPMAITVHAEGEELVVRFEVTDAEPEPEPERVLDLSQPEEVEGRG